MHLDPIPAMLATEAAAEDERLHEALMEEQGLLADHAAAQLRDSVGRSLLRLVGKMVKRTEEQHDTEAAEAVHEAARPIEELFRLRRAQMDGAAEALQAWTAAWPERAEAIGKGMASQ